MRVQVARVDGDLCRLCLGTRRNISAQMPSSFYSSSAKEGDREAGLAGCWEGPKALTAPCTWEVL